jgi:hypothetical protein
LLGPTRGRHPPGMPLGYDGQVYVLHQRGQRHVERIAGVTEKVLPHLEAMQPGDVLEGIHEIEKYDRMARRNFGLSDSSGAGGSLNIAVLTNQAAVTVSKN